MVPTSQLLQAFMDALCESPPPVGATHYSVSPGTLDLAAFSGVGSFQVTALDADDNVVLDHQCPVTNEVTPTPDLLISYGLFVDGVLDVMVTADAPGTFLVFISCPDNPSLNGGCNVNVA